MLNINFELYFYLFRFIQRGDIMVDRLIKIFSILAILFIISIIGFFSFKEFFWNDIYQERIDLTDYSSTNSATKSDIVKNNPITKTKNTSIFNLKQEPFTMALFGLDANNLDYGRSDTIMIVAVNPLKKEVSLLSIPRDLRVMIPGHGHDKITHAYNYGAGSSINTIENLLDIKIDYYATINLNGFKDLVDALGGIDVDVEKTLTFKDRLTKSVFTLEKGRQKLNGTQALNYARFRKDAEGDFGRNRRQKQVVSEIIEQSKDFRNIPKIKEMFKVLGKNIKTDVDLKTAIKFALNLKDIGKENVSTIEMKAYPTSLSGISYVGVDDAELNKVKQEFKDKLKGSE